jgi:hypothetical protein
MRHNTYIKSSITLPPAELELVNQLMSRLNAKSKVEVIRRGLLLLKEMYEVALLKDQFKHASQLVSEVNREDLEELDFVTGDGLVDED